VEGWWRMIIAQGENPGAGGTAQTTCREGDELTSPIR
jgi:hypothetical protein